MFDRNLSTNTFGLCVNHGIPAIDLWEEYKEQYPDGYQTTQFYEHNKRWKRKISPWIRQNHKAGDKLFVDYAGQTAPIYSQKTGEVYRAQMFVAVLGMGNYTCAEATWDQTFKNRIASHINAFQYFQGIPRLLVPDNLKSAMTRPNRYDPDINPTCYEMALHYGTVIFPAHVRKPMDKAKAEVGVRIVERWILTALRNRQITKSQRRPLFTGVGRWRGGGRR